MPSREEVLAVARLARLMFTTDELDRMAGELRGILAHVDALRQAVGDGEGVDPAGAEGPMRADGPAADPLAMPPSRLAPGWRDGFFTVPRLHTHDR